MDRALRTALFALGRGRNAHFRAVLGDGAAADLDAESRERQTKRLVRERRGRVLCANEALQPLLDRVGRDCRVGADRRGEKAAHGDDPALELNVFILRRTAHGGGADAHFFGKLLHRHGQQCLAATEKAVLLAPDEREHLYERVAAGVDALDEGLCFGELFFHVALDLGVVARVHQRGVFGVDGQVRQNTLVELDDELTLLHGKFRIGGDVGDLLAAGKAARGDRVEREYLGRSGPGFTDADAEQNGKAGKVALAEHF